MLLSSPPASLQTQCLCVALPDYLWILRINLCSHVVTSAAATSLQCHACPPMCLVHMPRHIGHRRRVRTPHEGPLRRPNSVFPVSRSRSRSRRPQHPERGRRTAAAWCRNAPVTTHESVTNLSHVGATSLCLATQSTSGVTAFVLPYHTHELSAASWLLPCSHVR